MAQAQKSGGGGGALYYEIASFQSGMDLRKSALTAPAGTLRLLKNADITQGGEIQKRPAFMEWCDAPAGSIGLVSINDKVYTHLVGGTPGQIVDPTTTSVGVIHIAAPAPVISLTAQIIPTSVLNLTALANGSMAIGAYLYGPDVLPNTRVVSYGTGSGGLGTYGVTPAQTSNPTSASEYITLTGYIAGTTFTCTSVPHGGSLGVGTVLIGGADVIAGTVISGLGTGTGGIGTYSVNNSQTSYPTGANCVLSLTSTITGAVPIMNVSAISGGTLAVGSRIHGTGVLANTTVVSILTGTGGVGTYQVTPLQQSYPSSASGAANTGVSLVQQMDFDVFDGKIFASFLGSDGIYYGYYNGVQAWEANNKVKNVRTYKNKMYGINGRYLYFSANGDPTIWNDPSPDSDGNVAHNLSGSINIGANDGDSEDLQSMEVYYDKMALFSKLSCQLWFLDPDPSLNQYYQTLRDAGTLAPNSVRQYVANDVYFLGTHGIRSLRARDLTMTASVADVGSPIDPVIQDLISSNPPDTLVWTTAVLSPRTGRIWFVMADRIYVLSNWPSPNISAWSVYAPEFMINKGDVVYADPYVVMRATDDSIYRFGSPGPTGLVYDSCPVEFDMPFLSFDKPVTNKFYQAFDAICTAEVGSMWNVEMSFDPTATPTPFDQICTMDDATVMGGSIPISGRGTHVQVRVTHQAPGPATFSKMFIHYAPSNTG